MSVAGGRTTFIANETIPSGRRVKYVGARKVELADAADKSIGVSGQLVTSVPAGGAVEVLLHNEPGTREVTAAGIIADGAAIYGAADGKVAAVAGGEVFGVALEAAGADLDKIEVLPRQEPTVA